MKTFAFLVTLFLALHFAVAGRPCVIQSIKKDTVRDIRNQPKRRVAKSRRDRMRLQMKQIRYHDKQQKKVDALQKEINKD